MEARRSFCMERNTMNRIKAESRYSMEKILRVFIVNDIANLCFRILREPYTKASARTRAKFPISLTIK